jgi:hypothetical protein
VKRWRDSVYQVERSAYWIFDCLKSIQQRHSSDDLTRQAVTMGAWLWSPQVNLPSRIRAACEAKHAAGSPDMFDEAQVIRLMLLTLGCLQLARLF